MEPMNAFLNSHRESFKTFIEEICFVPVSPSAMTEKPASYLTPLAIKSRLPPTSREGFPSLPFLIDEAREYAVLVDLWLKAFSSQDRTAGRGIRFSEENKALRRFHDICTALYSRAQECLNRAEQAERPSSNLSFRWEELIDSLQGSGLDNTIPLTGTDALPAAGHHEPLDDGIASQAGTVGLNSPLRKTAEHDWENDRDGGAASAAASLLSQDRNPRSGFVIPSTSSAMNLGSGRRASASAANASVLEALSSSVGSSIRAIGEVSIEGDDKGVGVMGGSSKKTTFSRSASALSDELSSDGEERTALPRVSTELAKRARWAREESERNRDQRDRDKARLVDLVPGLGRRKRDKERER